MTAWAIIGWFIFSYGPIATALLFWRWSKRARWPRALHLLFVPVALLAQWAGDSIMRHATQSGDWDDTIGAPIITGLYMSCVAVIGYFAAVLMHEGLWTVQTADPSGEALVDVTQRQD